MRTPFICLLSGLTLGLTLLVPQPVVAQTIQTSPHPLCDYEVLGPLEPDLTERLDGKAGPEGGSQIFDRYDQTMPINVGYGGPVVCLDSPGGSMEAGAALFRHFLDANLATVIPSGWRCESACAIAFLGGSVTEGTARFTSLARKLYPGGKIGFHAPSLRLPEGSAYSGSEVQSAFGAALAASDLIIRLSQIERENSTFLNGFLLRRILTTPPETVDYIDAVVEAAFAEVNVAAVPVPRKITIAQAENACDLAVARFLGLERERGISLSELGDMLKQLRQWRRGDQNAAASFNSTQDGPATRYEAKFSSYPFNARSVLTCKITISVEERIATEPVFYFDPFLPDDGRSRSGFRVDVSLWKHSWQTSLEEDEYASELKSFTVPAWFLLPPTTRFAELVSPEPRPVLYNNIDLPGNDVDQSGLRGVSLDGCIRACRDMAQCQAFSYVEDQRWCWPKRAPGTAEAKYGITSGVMPGVLRPKSQ